jgi:beta-lactam-binding protein with PASTA domain
MSFKSFLISKSFFKQVGIMMLIGIIIIFAVIKGLDIYTHNGEVIIVPYLSSADADSLMVLSSKEYLQYTIADSIYSDDKIPGTVVNQHPAPESKVKKGRRIYLTIVARTPEMVRMPNLIDLSIRRAVDIVLHAHLKIKEIVFEDDIALNAVLGQKMGALDIPADTMLASGSSITLIAGNGHNNKGVAIPYIIGLTVHEAQRTILQTSFNVGDIDTLDMDYGNHFRVFQQFPFSDPLNPSFKKLGSKISFILKPDNLINFDSLVLLHHTPDTTDVEPELIDPENTDF